MDFFYQQVTYTFDTLHRFWEHERVHKKISVLLVCVFLLNLLLIELNRQQFLSPSLAALIPTNHFHAIGTAFTIILILEVLSLIFVLPRSFSLSVGKQFELLALILLRDAFKELSSLPEPVSFLGNETAILRILSDGFGSLTIFGLLGLYYMVQKQSTETGEKTGYLYRFVSAKKSISLFLLGCFVVMGCGSIYHALLGLEQSDFFHNFYTLLILTDILIVLTSQCFLPSFFFNISQFRLCPVNPVYPAGFSGPGLLQCSLGCGCHFLCHHSYPYQQSIISREIAEKKQALSTQKKESNQIWKNIFYLIMEVADWPVKI